MRYENPNFEVIQFEKYEIRTPLNTSGDPGEASDWGEDVQSWGDWI